MSEQSSINTKIALAIVGGLIVGFVVGFALANNVNRQEDEKLRGELARLRAGGAQKDSGQPPAQRAQGADPSRREAGEGGQLPTLTDEQLKGAVTKADASVSDADTQKKAGRLLYYYALQTRDASLLPDAARILKRAHDLDAKDHDTAVLAGNAYFIVARNGGDDPSALTEASKLYEAALAMEPDDVDVRTSLGLAYFYGKPPDARRAIREYRQALKTEPRHEAALQGITLALIETGDLKEAETRLGELEKANPSNPELASLRTQLEQKKNAAPGAR